MRGRALSLCIFGLSVLVTTKGSRRISGLQWWGRGCAGAAAEGTSMFVALPSRVLAAAFCPLVCVFIKWYFFPSLSLCAFFRVYSLLCCVSFHSSHFML